MPTLEDIPTPALIVDLDVLERNLRQMATHCARLDVALRPHVKTHKCVEVGRMQEAAGAKGITVSTLYEGEVFATAGFSDILWAFPVVPSRLEQAVELSRRVRLGLVVDSSEAVDLLASTGESLRVWIKVDCGYHRCGIPPDPELATGLVSRIERAGHHFVGLLSHSGDAYDARGAEARAATAEAERACLAGLASALREAGHAVEAVSVGSTPGTTAAESLAGVTEARPGNYAYFDRTQVELGSCAIEDCAVGVIATVVSRHDGAAVVDAGALALSKDPGQGDGIMGALHRDLGGGPLNEELWLTSLSQEHGKLNGDLPWGSRVRIQPNHSCLTVACFTWAHAVRDGEVVARWRVWNGR